MRTGRHRNPSPGLVGPLKLLVVIAAVTIAALLLVGCGKPPRSGVVDWKQHSDAYSYVTTSCSRETTTRVGTGTRATTVRTCVAWSSHTWHRPAEWQLCIDADEGQGDDGCIDVPAEVWATYREGDRYPHQDPR